MVDVVGRVLFFALKNVDEEIRQRQLNIRESISFE
jgi:hypothetical protein